MTNSEAVSGWADAMSKILVVKKPKKNKTIVLSKGKKLSMMKIKTTEENETSDLQSKLDLPKKSEIFLKGMNKPDILGKSKERKLQKITVRGVVKLFNAVNKHQQTVSDKSETLGPAVTNKEKVMNSVSKKSFLNLLMGEEIGKEESTVEMKEEEEEIKTEPSSTWEVLQNKFGIGVKMKDWDNKNPDC